MTSFTESIVDNEPATMSERKLRLYACGCCRRIWDRLSPERQQAVIAAERVADGQAEAAMLEHVQQACRQEERKGLLILHSLGESDRGAYLLTEEVHRLAAPVFTSTDAQAVVQDLRPWRGQCLDNDLADAAHQQVYQDVFGSPELVVAFDPRWRTSAVQRFAWEIYHQRAFDQFSVLADRLTDAGCNDPDVLAHLRSGGEHVRGCWALDWVLGLG